MSHLTQSHITSRIKSRLDLDMPTIPSFDPTYGENDENDENGSSENASCTQCIDDIPIRDIKQLWTDFIANSYNIPIHVIHTTSHLENGFMYEHDDINIYFIMRELNFAIKGGRFGDNQLRVEHLLSGYLEFELPEPILNNLMDAFDQDDPQEMMSILEQNTEYMFPLPEHNNLEDDQDLPEEEPGEFRDILQRHLDRIKIVLPTFSREVFYHAIAGSTIDYSHLGQRFGMIRYLYDAQHQPIPSIPGAIPDILQDHQDHQDQDDDQDSVYELL